MSKVSIQIVQNYSNERTPSIVISQQKQKYLFNIGEPFLRYVKQHGIKFTSNMNIFFTRNSFDCMNGIQNILTSLYTSDAAYGTKIYGPRDFVSIIKKFRCPYTRFVQYSFYDLITHEKIVGIKDIAICKQLKRDKPTDFNLHYYDELDWNSFASSNFPSKLINDPATLINQKTKTFDSIDLQIDYIELSEQCFAYQINLPPNKGKLDKQKIDELKIQKNQMKKFLADGEIFIEELGRKVTIGEVQAPDKPGASCLIFDCPTKEILTIGIKNERILFNKSPTQEMKVVIHLASEEIIRDAQYQEFIGKFDADVKHIFVAPGLKEIIPQKEFSLINKPYRHQKIAATLNRDFPDNFLRISTQLTQFISEESLDVDQKQLLNSKKELIQNVFPTANVTLAKRYFEFILNSNSSEQYTVMNQVSDPEKLPSEFCDNDLYSKKVLNLKESLHVGSDLDTLVADPELFDPEITLLGTTCALPSKHRNNSSILISNKVNSTSVMLDAGEGSYFQLLSIFGQDRCDEELLNLKIILISHFHADHHMGMQEIIWRRQEVQRKRGLNYKDDPIFLVLPWDMSTWVQALRSKSDMLFFEEVYIQSYNEEDFAEYTKRIFDPSKKLCSDGYFNPYEEHKASVRNKRILQILTEGEEVLLLKQEAFKNKFKEIGYESIKMIPVLHCQQAYAFVLNADDKKNTKISYTGDTRPCTSFIDAAKGSSLVIHESTYAHDEVALAEKALHSTVTEAIDVALQSSSENLLLTHISKRHKFLKIHLEDQPEEFVKFAKTRTAMAYDFLKFKISEFNKLVKITTIAGQIHTKTEDLPTYS